ncbi:hypothetical protein, partial [Oleiphilus sp. HI0066]
MTQLSSLAVVEAHQLNSALPSQIQTLQKNAQEKLSTLVVPTRKTEHWKYSAKRLGDLSLLSNNSETVSTTAFVENAIYIDISAAGIDAAALSEIEESGLTLQAFTKLSDEDCSAIIELAEYERGELEQINTALFNDGLVIRIA